MKMPTKVFVKWDTCGNDPFLDAKTVKSDLAEINETVVIGEYRLVRTSKLSLKPVETDGENVG